jgi:PTS system fructose-specific IIC component
MGSGMVPPLGMALATALRGRLFTPAERENGKAAWLLGASFISEGAIPHGGIWVTPLISSPFLFLLALIIGTVITAGLVILLMGNKQRKILAADQRESVAVAA